MAIQELKAEEKLPKDTEHCQVKCLNNVVEADHGKLKRLIKQTLGFKSMKTAYATIKAFEAKPGPFSFRKAFGDKVRLVERCFNLTDHALMKMMNAHFQTEAS